MEIKIKLYGSSDPNQLVNILTPVNVKIRQS